MCALDCKSTGRAAVILGEVTGLHPVLRERSTPSGLKKEEKFYTRTVTKSG